MTLTPPAIGMRAVRLHGVGDLRVERIPPPGPPSADAVRLKVTAAGVCGSDLHNYRTGQWLGRTPTIPGHEFAAEVLEVGERVNGLAAGDLVVADSRVSCGACPRCLAGRPNICLRMGYVGEVCDGGFAEFVSLPEHRLLRVPAQVPPEIAALAEPLGVALRVIKRLDPPRKARIVIAGGGPIGGLAAILLDHLGFGPLAIIERNAARAQLAAGVANATLIAPTAAAVSAFGGADGVHFAIEATGSQAMFSLLTESLAGGGRLAMVGLFSGQPALNANAVVERELEIRGCSVFCDEQRDVVSMLPELAGKLGRIVSPPLALEELPLEYERLIAGQSPFLKSIIRP